MLINKTYHLLIGVAGRNTNKTGKLANTEVYMHKEIAGLHLLQLFHRQCHLALTSLVRLEIVLMETIENLMISKETYFQRTVNEAFMQCSVYRCERKSPHCRILTLSRHIGYG